MTSKQPYPEEFKIEAVKQITERGHRVADVSARIGVSQHSLYKWIKAYAVPASERQLQTSQAEELRRLKAELKRVTEERDILKKAAAYFAKQSGCLQLHRDVLQLPAPSFISSWAIAGRVRATTFPTAQRCLEKPGRFTSGPEDGDGARRAMALAQAGLAPEQVQYLNAHATSTYVGDRGELAAVRSLFGTGGAVAISSTKAATGHLLGAAGAVAAIFAALALRDQVVPATRNLVQPDALAEGLDLEAGSARPMPLQHALVNGFGFGGVNASLVLGRWAPGAS